MCNNMCPSPSKEVKQSCYRPEQAQRVDKGIALPFCDLDARRGCVVSTTPQPLYPRERPSTHCTEGWVGPRAGLDCQPYKTLTINTPRCSARCQPYKTLTINTARCSTHCQPYIHWQLISQDAAYAANHTIHWQLIPQDAVHTANHTITDN
jgi:hypothetical protein